ncbi:MAG TPA: tRNA (adenosine(37)-N6)-threonylcarbamoyltransferase complex dimerization subunit type 1 TsaB [Candidatus Limnocylindria bacterium]
MTLLAIDTSTAHASVALYDGRTVLAEATWYAQRRHDDHLFPEIDRLLALGGVALADVTRVGVAIGPGSFTGVRVAIAAAQGIARASDAATVGVATIDVAAWPFASARLRVCALIPAGRGEHYSAMYRRRRGAWERTSGIDIGTVADLARTIATDTIFAGEIDDATAAELRERVGARAILPSVGARIRRAGHLAEIAWERAEAGEGAHAGALEPLYIRPPMIRGKSGELV